jgi:hypothetical protein
MSKGFVVAEQGHIVLAQPPTGTGASGALSGAVFNMKNWAHASIIGMGGPGSAARIVTLKNVSSTAGSDATAITFRYAREDTTNGDTLDAALAWASSVTLAATANTIVAIELDADELADGKPYVHVQVSHRDCAVVAVLSGGRYQEDITATVLS